MIPVKEIMAMQCTVPGPPILIIDETTIKCTVDAGPVCGCYEKYFAVQNYKPFVPGGTNPYIIKKTCSPEAEELKIIWHKTQAAQSCNFDKPVAVHPCELTEQTDHSNEIEVKDTMYVRLPRYPEGYFEEKLRQHKIVHVEDCDCPVY